MTMRSGWSVAGAALCAVLAGSVGAAEEQVPTGLRGMLLKSRLAGVFAKADVNHDGHLTREEAQAGMPRVYAHFDEIDRDKKGFVTLEQIRGFLEASAAIGKSPNAPAGAPTQKHSQ
jgi:hypothetical protein